MKVVILAGGLGTRLSEETVLKPKPMVEIGGKPIIWHIMKIYSHYGFNEFIICAGYKGYLIKEFFHHYYMYESDVTINLADNDLTYFNSTAEPWKITIIDTGLHTLTGGRIKRIEKYINNERFLLTYGDGLANINMHELIGFHAKQKRHATLTAVQPTSRFGALEMSENGNVTSFVEKPKGTGGWISAGFFVLEPEIFNYIQDGDKTIWELQPLERLAADNQLAAYKYNGYWRPMDTLRDKNELELLWQSNKADWKVWN